MGEVGLPLLVLLGGPYYGIQDFNKDGFLCDYLGYDCGNSWRYK
jgi:hypothetical protein